jgi:hypothetical protein
MRLIANPLIASPETTDYIRASGDIVFGQDRTCQLWVDVPEDQAESLAISGNPWLVAMLPMAAKLGEDIELSLPVDALLLENVQGLLTQWREWYPELHLVNIRCPVKGFDPDQPKRRTAAFFSGGIDSYFSIARRMPQRVENIPSVGQVDDLLTVWGFDVGVNDVDQFNPIAQSLAASAKAMSLNHLIVRTNLREALPIYKSHWGPLTHGAGLAFVGLMLEHRFSEIVMGSTYPYGALFPWGSHPLSDPLFSTSSLRFVHDGAAVTRIYKTEIAARLPQTQHSLHVCQAEGIKNCSRCEKCYRTMIALDILGLKESFATVFDWSDYSLENIKRVFIGSGLQQIFYQEMLEEAKKRKRFDIARALAQSSRRSIVAAPMVFAAEWLMRQPVVWRFGVFLRQWVLKGFIQKEYIVLR